MSHDVKPKTGSSSRSPSARVDLTQDEEDDKYTGRENGGRLNGAEEDRHQSRARMVDGQSDAQQRYNKDVAAHAYEPPVPERVSDDWQVAYAWAFIVKFDMKAKIRRLECLEDFERCLVEPVANRPDDVLEGVLVQFMKNLKPGLRNVDCTNVQTHVSNYITDQLNNSSEFTVWDRPWAPNEEARSLCCNKSEQRLELGRLRGPDEEKSVRAKRNPLEQIEERGGGLFELDWHERARLLRQLVDWQLTHSDVIRNLIKGAQPPAKRKAPKSEEEAEEIKKSEEMWRLEPIGLDRNKHRIWSFDDTARLYQSGNPFKRPCPLSAICTSSDELRAVQEQYAAYGLSKPSKPKSSGTKGNSAKKDGLAYRRVVAGVENEKKLATLIESDILPKAEKEEARVVRARRKIAENLRILQAAELRSTRTRRPARKVDYSYDSIDEDDEPRRRGRGAATASYEPSRARPLIPGERRSARVRAQVDFDDSYDEGTNGGDSVDDSAVPSRTTSPAPSKEPRAPEVFPDGVKGTKGYAWIEESVTEPPANGEHSSPSRDHVEAIEVDN